MAKRFSKKQTKRTKVRLTPREAENIIEKEFTDDKGNKTKLRFDFNPHPIGKPTIELDYEYGVRK